MSCLEQTPTYVRRSASPPALSNAHVMTMDTFSEKYSTMHTYTPTWCTASYWGMANKGKQEKLHGIQIRAMRAVTPPGSRPLTPEDLKALPLPHLLTYRACNFVHNQLMQRGPQVPNLSLLGEGRHTRAHNSKTLAIEKRCTQTGARLHHVKTAKILNSLPVEIRKTESSPLFKKRLKLLLS